jgi:hypothetical protein
VIFLGRAFWYDVSAVVPFPCFYESSVDSDSERSFCTWAVPLPGLESPPMLADSAWSGSITAQVAPSRFSLSNARYVSYSEKL